MQHCIRSNVYLFGIALNILQTPLLATYVKQIKTATGSGTAPTHAHLIIYVILAAVSCHRHVRSGVNVTIIIYIRVHSRCKFQQLISYKD